MKELAIVSGFVDPVCLRSAQSRSIDVMALDLAGMQACWSVGLPFITPSAIYPPRTFRLEFSRFLPQLERILETVDREYEREIGYPRSFNGNLYSFGCYFADIHYLGNVAQGLSTRYSRQHFYISATMSTERIDTASTMDCDVWRSSLIRKADASSYNVQCLMQLLPEAKVTKCWHAAEGDVARPRGRWMRRAQLLRPRFWAELAFRLRIRLARVKRVGSGDRPVWCIQDDFEVDALMSELKEFEFVDPTAALRQRLSGTGPQREIAPHFTRAANELAELYPECASDIHGLMARYHEGVVCKLKGLWDAVLEQIESDRPACGLYSIGALSAVEDVYAVAMNARHVPIYYFQHGGGNVYYRSPLDAYIERHTKIDRTMLFVSKAEQEIRAHENPTIRSITVGSIRLQKQHERLSRRTARRGNGRVLYVQARYPSQMWKNLFACEDEDLAFKKHLDFFELAHELGLKVDVKLFPEAASHYSRYFERLLKGHGVRGRLLADQRAEMIAPDYSLVVIEYLGSALNPFLMLLDRPIIYSLYEPELINPEVAGDLGRRHRIASNRDEMRRLLQSFRSDGLPSQYAAEFVDRYVYPLNAEPPAVRVAEILDQHYRTGVCA